MTIACEQNLMDYALGYIARGFSVLPLCWPNDNGTCGCGRNHQGKDIGKAPLPQHGLNDATQLQIRVKEYWTAWPEANIGIAIPIGYFVLDVDVEYGGFDSLHLLQEKISALPDTLKITTGSGGLHFWFKTKEHIRNTVNLGGFPGIDIRGEGGYVVAPPSLHRCGHKYEVAEDLLIIEAPESLIALCMQKQSRPLDDLISGNAIPEGQRNQTLASLAGTMRRRGMSEAAIEAALQVDNRERCPQPLTEKEVTKIARSVATYPPATPSGNKDSVYTVVDTAVADTKRHKNVTENVTKEGVIDDDRHNLSSTIEDWVKDTSGWWSIDELDKELEVKGEDQRHNRRTIIYRLKKSEVIEQHPKQNKMFRRIDKTARFIDFKNAGNCRPLALKFPFEIEKKVNIYPKNIIVLAGAPNAGKTAWLLNFVKLNMSDFGIYYFSSEMGDAELALRLSKFKGLSLNDWNFTPEERSSNFSDVIRPDCINIIDFLEIDHDFNEIAGQIRQIYDKLNSGIAIVAIQKSPSVDLGRGGTFSLEKARLYLSMDAGVTTITKAKNWVNPESNPNQMKISYKIVGGCDFLIQRQWYKED